jgi:hypothetical protein
MSELGVALRSKRCACLRKPHFLFLAHAWRYSSDIWARKGQKRRHGGGGGGGGGDGSAEGGEVPSARQSQRMRAKREVADASAPSGAAVAAAAVAVAAAHAHAYSHAATAHYVQQLYPHAAHAAAQAQAAAHAHAHAAAAQAQHAHAQQAASASAHSHLFPALPPAPLLPMGTTHVQPETAWLLIPSQLRPLTLEATQLLAGDQAHAAALAFGSDHISRDALEGTAVYRRECADAGLYFGTLHAACVRAHMAMEHTGGGGGGAAGGGASGAAGAVGGGAVITGGVGGASSSGASVPQGDAEACLSGAFMPYVHRALGVYAGRVAAPGTSPAEAVWLTELHRAMALLAAAMERAVAIMRGARAEGATRSAALKARDGHKNKSASQKCVQSSISNQTSSVFPSLLPPRRWSASCWSGCRLWLPPRTRRSCTERRG